MIGTTEIIAIVATILLLFGGSQIPKLMRGIGQGVNAYKKGLKGEDEDEKEDTKKEKKEEKEEKKE